MKEITAKLLITLLVLITPNYCQGSLTVLPKTVIDVLYNRANFHCASASYAIYWEVDGIQARTVQVQARGITFMTTSSLTPGTETTSVLTVESSAANNNSQVVCVALNIENGQIVQRSPPAYLIIQGLLAAPANIILISANLTAIEISWTPPFTLNITNEDEDILFYTIKITNYDTGEVSFDNSTYPGFTLLSMKAFQCDSFGFQVTGWNSAGEGNISDIFNASFKKPLMLSGHSVANTSINNSVQFHCEYACIFNTVAAWFIEERIDMDINSDQFIIRRLSNRNEACKTSATDTSLHYIEILEINPLASFGYPIPVYCAYIQACNKHNYNHIMECRPRICFSDLIGEFRVVESKMNEGNHTEVSVTELGMDVNDIGESSLSKINFHGIIAGLTTSLVLNVLIIVAIILLLLIFFKKVKNRNSSQAPNQALYSEVLQGAIYDEVRAPADQHHPLDSSEVTTEVCPAYNITFCTK